MNEWRRQQTQQQEQNNNIIGYAVTINSISKNQQNPLTKWKSHRQFTQSITKRDC